MANKKEEKEWCPTQEGRYTAYKAEYCEGVTWKSIPTERNKNGTGFPYPDFLGGISKQVGLCGFEQSKAIAWAYAACFAGVGAKIPKTRVIEYEVKYNIKARIIGPVKG